MMTTYAYPEKQERKRYRENVLCSFFANNFKGSKSATSNQRTLTVGGSITVRLVFSLTSLDSAASLLTKTTYFLPESTQVSGQILRTQPLL